VDLTIDFNLDLGAKVQAVVPQPITRNPSTGALSQNLRAIEVYFDHNELSPTLRFIAWSTQQPVPTDRSRCRKA
jgi:hypothetical protein